LADSDCLRTKVKYSRFTLHDGYLRDTDYSKQEGCYEEMVTMDKRHIGDFEVNLTQSDPI